MLRECESEYKQRIAMTRLGDYDRNSGELNSKTLLLWVVASEAPVIRPRHSMVVMIQAGHG